MLSLVRCLLNVLPENYTDDLIYTTIDRGNAHEKLNASPETIEAVQNGVPMPDGTVLTLEIYRDEVFSDIFVMEKRSDWGDQPTEKQNGDWRFQAYNVDRSLNTKRDVASCISCHASQERDDYIYTLDEMKTFQIKDIFHNKIKTRP
ncbi:cytochrome P460 family protein [Bacillus sp. FJAT-28004]|uniref:cytochrome P460 family protein n=1 Tax=Bacillus sp. FJAT-28004 TaxID=1679165 RepID=UPI0006B479DC|nr:cytochrome P460 family protein [Bacillus sp. FJAT-28004]